MLAIVWVSLACCHDRRSVNELLSEQPSRSTQGQLAGLEIYRPDLDRDPVEPLYKRIPLDQLGSWVRLQQSIELALAEAPRPARLRDGAYLDLAFGQYAHAALRLEELRSLSGDTPALLNDLAVIFLEWGLAEDRPLELLEALRFSSKAVVSESPCAPCRFNYALALSHLYLRNRAVAEWNNFISLNPRSPWADEAREWISRLTSDSYEDDLARLRADLLSPGAIDEERLRRWVESRPDEVRTLMEEEALSRWALASRNGEPEVALSWLDRAERAGHWLSRRGSWLLADAVTRLREAPSPDLIAGHDLFARAMAAYHGQSFAQAETLLASAAQALEAGGSIYADVARLYQAICIYYRNVDAARPIFEALLERSSPERHPTLVGRTLWMLGILDMVQRRTDLALSRYSLMRPLLEAGMGADRAAIVDTMLAETLELRGEVERGWRHRVQGLARLIDRTDARRRHSALLEAAQALARRGDAELALIFLDEVAANASRWGQPLGQAEALSARARARALINDLAGARDDAMLALQALSHMPPGDPLRERTASLTRLYLGIVQAKEEPAAGLQRMQKAHDELEAGGWREEHLAYLEQRAQALIAMGNMDEGRKTLLASVKEIERLRTQTEDTMSRLEILHHAQTFHESLIRLALDLSTAESFDQAERARGRELLGHADAELSVADRAIAELPEDETLLLFTALPEDLLVWIVREGWIDRVSLKLTQAALQQSVALFVNALRVGDDPTARRIGAHLYAQLIEPLGLDFRADGRLVIVPDLKLAEMPFAALFDATDQTFLIEKTSIAQTPSVNLYLDVIRKRSLQPLSSALIVGDPDLRDSSFRALAPLKRAREEAAWVAGWFPQSRLLLGSEAKPDEVVASLPNFMVFHFAGHAFASGPSLEDSLLLLTPNAEGRAELTASEVRQLDLSYVRLAVLSACHSADGIRKGREAAASLAAAFLAAGVPTVVAARWGIDDRTSLDLMQRLYSHLGASTDVASAYRRVVLDLLSSEQSRGPSYWAAFVVLGA